MVAIIWITVFLILVYFCYPVCLKIFFQFASRGYKETGKIDSISVILLSYNGGKQLAEKARQLINELKSFKNGELILIDDDSTDNSLEALKVFADKPNFRIIRKKDHSGIPNSMNLGVMEAKNEFVVFCDQRQNIPVNGLKKLLDPLQYNNVGAVSGCLCQEERPSCKSIIRQHENKIKILESRTGNLIGVYGPLYAVKKSVYQPIPHHIILDDLYLTLKILKSRQVLLVEDCRINDRNFSNLYDYARAKRYLIGFLQLLREKDLIWNLGTKQVIMLLWHKYLRLCIPLMAGIGYLISGLMINNRIIYQAYFGILSFLGITAIFQWKVYGQSRLLEILKIQIYYFLAFFDILANRIFGIENTARKRTGRTVQPEIYETTVK
jgi:glycosyltransferase involved in cell wall biosynthesis